MDGYINPVEMKAVLRLFLPKGPSRKPSIYLPSQSCRKMMRTWGKSLTGENRIKEGKTQGCGLIAKGMGGLISDHTRMDTNHDGMITYDEFVQCVKQSADSDLYRFRNFPLV